MDDRPDKYFYQAERIGNVMKKDKERMTNKDKIKVLEIRLSYWKEKNENGIKLENRLRVLLIKYLIIC